MGRWVQKGPMALIPEHHILDHIQQLIRREGQGHRESHRFANAVQNDVILTYRLRELRLRSQERPRRRGATRPGRAPQPRRDIADPGIAAGSVKPIRNNHAVAICARPGKPDSQATSHGRFWPAGIW
mgnify:CR=1 FL=1